MEGNPKFALIKTKENDGENDQQQQSHIDLESLLRQFKLSQTSIQQITEHYNDMDHIIASNKPPEQIAAEFDLDSIDKFRFIRNISKLIEKHNNTKTFDNIKRVIVSTQEQQAMDALYKRFENVSNLINNIQIGINDLNKCHDVQSKLINDYFDDKLLKQVMDKKNELLANADKLNTNKYETLQNQIKNTEFQVKQLNDAKLKCNELTASNSISMMQRKKIILKYKTDLCSNTKFALCPITRPMMKFDINEYYKNINETVFKHISIDNCDQPIIHSIRLMDNAVHSMSICWNIDDSIYNKLNLKKPAFFASSKKSKKSDSKKQHKSKLNSVLNQLQTRVHKIEPTIYSVFGNKKYKDTKEAKKKCKIIFQVSWKEIDNEVIERKQNNNNDENDDENDHKSSSEEEGASLITNIKKKKKKSSRKQSKKKKIPEQVQVVNDMNDDEKDDSWLYSKEIYDNFSCTIRFLNGGSKYYVRVRSKYKKSKEWGLWSLKHIFSTQKLQLKWSQQKCNNNPEPKFDLKHKNKIKIKESSISKIGVEYVINCKRYELFTISFKIDKFSKSNKKGAVYLGFMTSNIDTYKLNTNGYNKISKLQAEIQQNSSPNSRRLHKRNVYYKVPLGNMNGFEPVTIDPFAYCIEIKEGKSYIKMYTPQKQGKEIELFDDDNISSKVSINDIWTFEFRMKKKYCLVYRNNILIMNKKYLKQIPNAISPIISNSRHKNTCIVHIFAGKCKRVESM